jgi:hypothetical protein
LPTTPIATPTKVINNPQNGAISIRSRDIEVSEVSRPTDIAEGLASGFVSAPSLAPHSRQKL